MGVAASVAGAGLVALVMADVLRTTLGASGGGRMTRWVARQWWTYAHRSRRDPRARVRRVSGPAILVLTLLSWVVLLWGGWTLVFSASPAAVVGSEGAAPGTLVDRLYFTGYTLFTLGIGDVVPGRGAWQVITIVATINGFFVATLAVAYVIPTLAAAVEKRRLAAWISTLGETPQEILASAWDGTTFAGLESHLAALVPAIELHAQRHRAYPIVHYFHGADRRSSIGPSIAALDEAVAVLLYAVRTDSRPPAATLLAVRHSITGLLETLGDGFLLVGADPPPRPDLSGLRAAGLPIELVAGPPDRLPPEQDRRAVLHAYVLESGGRWFAGAAHH